MAIVEGGVLGLTAILALFAVSLMMATAVRRGTPDDALSSLSLAIAGSLCASLVTMTFYDAWSFNTARTLTFLMFGCGAALWRLDGRRSLYRGRGPRDIGSSTPAERAPCQHE